MVCFLFVVGFSVMLLRLATASPFFVFALTVTAPEPGPKASWPSFTRLNESQLAPVAGTVTSSAALDDACALPVAVPIATSMLSTLPSVPFGQAISAMTSYVPARPAVTGHST